eukprot:m.185729 g.185729  ORF g.185729 m.185729 type:complete len:65 (+) comp15581_c0_seq7:596-790(+)
MLINKHHDRYKPARAVSVGAEKWLKIHMYSQPEECIRDLQKAGYYVYGAGFLLLCLQLRTQSCG